MLSKKTLTSSIALDPIERIWKSSLHKNSWIRSKICSYKKVTHLNQAIRAFVTRFNPFSNIFSKIKRYKKFKNLGELINSQRRRKIMRGGQKILKNKREKLAKHIIFLERNKLRSKDRTWFDVLQETAWRPYLYYLVKPDMQKWETEVVLLTFFSELFALSLAYAWSNKQLDPLYSLLFPCLPCQADWNNGLPFDIFMSIAWREKKAHNFKESRGL